MLGVRCQATLEELQDEAQEYEKIKADEVKQLKIDEFSRFPEILIKARIAKGWTQEQLAEKLGLKPLLKTYSNLLI